MSPSPPVVGLLRAAYRAARRRLVEDGRTGRRWRRPVRDCPPYCARGHHCTAGDGYPSGEHRSAPAAWRPSYGSIVASRVGGRDGTWLELRISVRLDDEDGTAHVQASNIVLGIDLTIRTIMAELAARSRPVPGGRPVLRPALPPPPSPSPSWLPATGPWSTLPAVPVPSRGRS